MTRHIIPFPTCFSEANNKLRTRFRGLDSATIEDGVQYARIEYWMQHIDERIHDDREALGWLLHVARRYLYKEVNRLNKHCNISSAINLSIGIDIERQFIYKEMISSFDKTDSDKRTSTLIRHAMGYSLKELAESEHISSDAMRQRHARERTQAKKKEKHLFH